MYRFPIFEIVPSRSLPPLECGLGVKPSQADRSRAVLKFDTSGSVAANALEVIEPTPGMVWRRRAASSLSAAFRISAVTSSTFVCVSRNCSASSLSGLRALSGSAASSAIPRRRSTL